MTNFCKDIEDNKVYPILIKNGGNSYLTLYYYPDSILHNDAKNLLCFKSRDDMEHFCIINDLTIEEDVVEYDFDAPITNPIDYKRILNNWNLLNTIASIFGMYFEGDLKKYNALYDLLFRLNTPAWPIPPTYKVSEKHFKDILKVFRKKERFLKRFEMYLE